MVSSPGDGSFFDQYARLGGLSRQLDASISPTVVLRIPFDDSYRMVGSLGYLRNGFDETHPISQAPGAESTTSIVEQFALTAVPVLAGVEVAPIRTQFTTYVGAMVGAAVASVEWTTSVRGSGTNGDYYRPAENVSGTSFGPAARIYAGVDLRFDRFDADAPGIFRGIYFEGSYLWLPIARAYFHAIRTGARGLPEQPQSDSATLLPGGLALTLGINLQFQGHNRAPAH